MKGPASSANENNAVIWPELWQAFSVHRQQVSDLLQSVASSPSATLCIWGAGRTTDLDIISLLEHYQRIDLVDINAQLTEQAMIQRGFDENPRVRVLPAFDLSGMEPYWDEISGQPIESKCATIAKICAAHQLDLGEYDVVASTCLLSQILQKASGELGLLSGIDRSNSDLFNALKLLRERHVQLMLKHTKAGGTSLLISDVTSSESLTEINDAGCDLNQLMKTKVMQGNHFHGLNPNLILGLARSPEFENQIAGFKVSAPWIWDALNQKYLCLAFRILKQKRLA